MALPLTNHNLIDAIFWKENKAQRFSVWTTYQMALRLQNHNRVEHLAAQLHHPTWNKLWILNVPPKVHSFIWRACSNCWPTRDNLHRKWVKVDARCELCCQHPETIRHLLWACLFARNVWGMVRDQIYKCSNKAEEWVVMAWAIWNAKNKFYFQQVQTHPRVILEEAKGLLEEYHRLLAAQALT